MAPRKSRTLNSVRIESVDIRSVCDITASLPTAHSYIEPLNANRKRTVLVRIWRFHMEIYLVGSMSCYGSGCNGAQKCREKAKDCFFRWGESCRIIGPVAYYSNGSDASKNPCELM